MAPVMTTKMKADRERALANTSPWNWAQNNTDTYFGLVALQTAIGRDAVASGDNSMALGVSAQAQVEKSLSVGNSSDTEGSGALAIGWRAKAKNNGSIAIGSYVNTYLNDGNYNPVYDNGENSIAIGTNSWARGNDTIAIGNGVRSGTQTGTIAIGSNVNAVGDAPNTVIGNGATTSTTVSNGITIGYNAKSESSGILIGTGKTLKDGAAVAIGGSAEGSDAEAEGEGAIAIGYSASAYGENCIVIGNNISTSYSNTITLASDVRVSKDLYVNNTKIASDRRLKYVGKEFTSGLDKIRQIKPFNYTFKKDETKTPRVGVIAQDLMKIFPNAVTKGADGFFSIRMEDMFYAVINAVKELDSRVSRLEKENKELKARLEKLEAKLK